MSEAFNLIPPDVSPLTSGAEVTRKENRFLFAIWKGIYEKHSSVHPQRSMA